VRSLSRPIAEFLEPGARLGSATDHPSRGSARDGRDRSAAEDSGPSKRC